MGILRSEQMKHGTLVLPIDRAREFIDLVGASTKMQFEDMNARNMHRPYKKYIQRIDEMERILRFLTDELDRVPHDEVIQNNVTSFLENADKYKLDEVEARLKQIHREFIQFKENNANLTARRNATLEERNVIQTAIVSMAQISARPSGARALRSAQGEDEEFEYEASRSLLDDEEGGQRRTLETMFSNIAGVIAQADQDRFARHLHRATRGNTFINFQQIFEPMQDPKTGREMHKSVFVIYFQDHRAGSSVSAMCEKITKICAAYGVNTYRWPSSREAAEELFQSLQVQVEDQQRLLKAHEAFVRSEATTLLEVTRPDGNSLIEEWRMFCVKEKSLYATLNLFEGHMNLRANCWYPAEQEDHIRALLIQHSSRQHGHSSAMLVSDRTQPRKNPPTYIRKNQFTGVFQDLVDTYGLPKYGEINPALFTIVTFPFLFGVMYGDVGHGSMLLALGIYAIWKADELKFSIPQLYEARYILTMMGVFGVYAGFLYNDFFSLGLNLFDSRWQHPAGVHPRQGQVITFEPVPGADIRNEGGMGPYPFGVDPAWHGAQNELVFMNSMKMKLSVIIGVTQMTIGLFLRFSNAVYERNATDFFCECVPMMVFMVCFFGFMDYMILYKWVTPMDNPPSIINSMIAMAMWQEDPNPMLGASLPKMLMGMAIFAVPFMLIPKPLIKLYQHKAKVELSRSGGSGGHRAGGPAGPGAGGHGIGRHMPLGDNEDVEALRPHVKDHSLEEEEEEEFDLGELVIHQVIETIEYVLGTVSHTASYLRLWALSLAHQQLSVVFFSMTILSGMTAPFPLNIIAVYLCFAMWFGITLAILLGMDVMECFLHTLRLHWVEFQSKFYKAGGEKFAPYDIKQLVAAEE
mmetsp:Transcript_60124/g.158159  ORF Transcript_60124/g.158159 Transcript_60124/m.158159 type:complete len:864 (-) Transcript_60124:297-2888(-)